MTRGAPEGVMSRRDLGGDYATRDVFDLPPARCTVFSPSGARRVAVGMIAAVALLLGAFLSFLLPAKFDRAMLSTTGWVGEAMTSAAIIIVITGAGGAFGKVLQNSGIADVIGSALQGREGVGIRLPVLIAAALKTAQGSSTVALITTAGLVLPLLAPLGLEGATARALVVVAIGAGSMMVSHANDSFFWVVTQFSGMTALPVSAS